MWISTIIPVPLSSVDSFATTNYMSNVYGVDDDKKVIYPLHVSPTLFQIDMSICYCLNVMVVTYIDYKLTVRRE